MNNEYIKRVNQAVDEELKIKKIISVKEMIPLVFAAVKDYFPKEYDEEYCGKIVRNRLSWLTKNSDLERVAHGIYMSNTAIEYSGGYYDFNDQITSEISETLDIDFKGKWFWVKSSLREYLQLTDQVSKVKYIHINTQSNNKINNLKKYLQQYNIKLSAYRIQYVSDIKMYWIKDLMGRRVLDESEINSLVSYFNYFKIDPFELLVEPDSETKHIQGRMRHIFKGNIKKIIGVKYGQ